MKLKQKSFKLIYAALLLIICTSLYGQTKNNYSVSGILLDSLNRQPIEYASVSVYRLIDTTLITGTITNPKGEFTINNLPSGKYFIRSSFIGYKTKTTIVEINNSSLNFAEPILINNSSIYFNTVTITGQQSEKQINIEKTKINVAQSIAAVSGNVTEVLKSQPSISIDADNNIHLRGNSNILILTDGRPTTVTSLNSMPASGIESIEIVTNPDVKYDAEGTGGIINVVMKKQSVSNVNSSATLNYGFKNRINGGLRLNYSKNIWDISLSYNGKYEKSDIQSNLTRQLYSPSAYFTQEINSTQTSPTHTAALSLSAKPDNSNIITFSLKIVLPSISNTQNIIGSQLTNNSIEGVFNRRNEVTFDRKVIETTLNYKKIFEKNKNEISFDAFYSRTKGSRPAEYYIENKLLQKSDGGGTPTNLTVQTDYLKSLFATGKIECGLKYFSRWNDFNYNFYDFDLMSNQWLINLEFSNDLEHKEYIYSSYLMYSDNLLNNLFYKIGFRLEYNTSKLIQKSISYQNDETYFFPFPYLLLKYNVDKTQEIALSFNRRITRPTYPQLNPFIIVIDQMTYETGNKNLDPEIVDKVELSHSWIKEKLQLSSNLYFSTTKDFITQISTLSNSNKLIVTYVNGNRQNKIGGDFDARYKFNGILSVNPSLSLFYTKSNGNHNGIDLGTSNLAWAGNIKTVIKPVENTELQILLNYNSPIDLPQFKLDKIYYADIALKYNLVNNKLALNLAVSDVFNTRKWNIESANSVFRLNNSSKNDTRVFWFGLTYSLDSYKANESQKTEGTDERELIKLGQQ
jgi:outer membrane receptor protein involved in Fe transport